jgi:hypothetical protein
MLVEGKGQLRLHFAQALTGNSFWLEARGNSTRVVFLQLVAISDFDRSWQEDRGRGGDDGRGIAHEAMSWGLCCIVY